MTDPFNLLGKQIDGKYRVDQVIGEGGFGIVYRGHHQGWGVPVAIKCLKLFDVFDEEERKRFAERLKDEGRVLHELSRATPFVVQALDAGVHEPEGSDNWIPYLVMEWLEGETLAQYLAGRQAKSEGGLPFREALRLLAPAAAALALAHNMGVSHRDIKPENLFVTKSHGVKVLDFGVAKVLDERYRISRAIDQTSSTPAAFTQAYGAPEQFDRDEFGPTGTWTDVFALALVLIELVSGRRALTGIGLMDYYRASVGDVRPSLQRRGVAISQEIEAVIQQAVQVKPKQRHPNVGTFWAALNEAAGQRGQRQALYIHAEGDELLIDAMKNYMKTSLQDFSVTWTARKVSAKRPDSDSSSTLGAPEVPISLVNHDIVLVFLSQALLSSEFIKGNEVQRLMERHNRGMLRVVPVVLRPIPDWDSLPFQALVPLPRCGTPVTTWENQDDAYRELSSNLSFLLKDVPNGQPVSVVPSTKLSRLNDVFTPDGMPGITFVETPEFNELKVRLGVPGRGLIVEGPSGVGKTTALKKACAQLRDESGPWLIPETILSARRKGDIERINTIEQWHKEGVVAIDDFHRLDDDKLSQRVSDYMKLLADEGSESKRKLVVVGIPGAGQTLMRRSADLAMRKDVIKFGRVEDEAIFQMIKKGEDAMNISIERKSDIALLASGSFNLAQLFCYNICLTRGVLQTKVRRESVPWSRDKLVSKIMPLLVDKFRDVVEQIGHLGEGEWDLAPIWMLKHIPGAKDGLLSLPKLMRSKARFAHGIKYLLDNHRLHDLYRDTRTELHKHLFYDERASALVVEDPQLMFFLTQITFVDLAKRAGKAAAVERPRILVVYSQYDNDLKQILVNRLEGRFPDAQIHDKQAAAGGQWMLSLQGVLPAAVAVIVLVSKGFLDAIKSIDELVRLFEEAEQGGAKIIPLVLPQCRVEKTAFSRLELTQIPNGPLPDVVEQIVAEIYPLLALRMLKTPSIDL